MAIQTPNSTVGLLINNPSPQPDGSVSNPNIVSMAAAGSTQVTAVALTAPTTIITNNTAANGVILPVGSKGQVVTVIPQLATNAPRIYPPVGGTVNFGTVNVHAAAPAQRRTSFQCLDTAGLTWASDSLTA